MVEAVNKKNRKNKTNYLYERIEKYSDKEGSSAFDPVNSILIVKVLFKNMKRFNKVFQQPFDEGCFTLLQNTADYLVNVFRAVYAHVGTNDITLILVGNKKTPLDYAGRKQKLVSSITSAATNHFSLKLAETRDIDEMLDKGVYPTFEVSIFSVPDKIEASNVILWTERENTKKCINAITNYLGITKNLENTKYVDRIDVIINLEYNWNAVKDKFKYGTYIKRIKVEEDIESSNRYSAMLQTEPFTNSKIQYRVKRIFDY